MDLKELTELIAIRQYVVNSVNNASIDRKTVNVMNGTLLLLDKKILGLLQSDEFKTYINYSDVSQAIKDVAYITNIRSGLPKK